MKTICPLLILACIIAVFACHAPKKTTYEFPAEMKDFVKVEYAKQCEKGEVLYQINCGPCHNRKVKGRTVVPDFKPEQLVGYSLRVSNAKHESSLEDDKITTEEFGMIMSFLTYKQKSGVPQ